ncbi:MAG: formylglycine-generating enzyme family protein [Candidatus Cloacimonadaceae bacterium]
MAWGGNYPVYNVTWYSILKYCNLLSMNEGLIPCYTISDSIDPSDWGSVPTSSNDAWNAAICNWDANGYRLPTEAEWEYAARGATNDPDYLYSGSDNIDVVAWYNGNSGSTTHIVGTKNPNTLGIYDMTGNVWEWCWDWYGGYSADAQDNPTGPESGFSRLRRGSSWFNNYQNCRITIRAIGAPYISGTGGDYGFRLCRSAL